jgi:hypothetical protein
MLLLGSLINVELYFSLKVLTSTQAILRSIREVLGLYLGPAIANEVFHALLQSPSHGSVSNMYIRTVSCYIASN